MQGLYPNHMHIFRPWRKHVQSFKKIGIKLYEELRSQGTHCLYIEVEKWLSSQSGKSDKKESNNYIQTTCTSSHHEENICKVSKRSVKNCRRSCAHKTPRVNVDGGTEGRTDKRTETFTLKSPMLKQVRQKATEKRWRHRFFHYKSMGAFCCHGNQSFDPICPKTLCSLCPTPVMLHIKFDQD